MLFSRKDQSGVQLRMNPPTKNKNRRNNQTTNVELHMVSKTKRNRRENEGKVEDIIKRSVNAAHFHLLKDWIARKVDTILLTCIIIMLSAAATLGYALNNSQMVGALSSSPMPPPELKKLH